MRRTPIAPPIDQIQVRDESTRTWTHRIAVVGARASEFVGLVTKGAADTRALVELGELRGWSLRLALYAMDAGTSERTMRDHLALCRGWIIAAEPPGEDPVWTRLEQLARWVDAQRPDVVAAVFGDDALARTWRAYGGREPVVVDRTPATVLSALTRALLR